MMFLHDVKVEHTFRFVGNNQTKSVFVAGTFNNWNAGADKLQLDPDGRTWSIHLKLSAGKYTYKFVVNNQWMLDPSNPKVENDGGGNDNSVLILQPNDYVKSAKKGDGDISASAISHDPNGSDLNFDRGMMSFKLRVRPNDIERIELVVNGKAVPMTESPGDEFYAKASASVKWDQKTDLKYFFRLTDGNKVVRYGANGAATSPTVFGVNAKSFRPIQVPKWVEGSVLYQIFPDRFANGNKDNDLPNGVSWETEPTYGNHFGGDVAGIEQHLAYLKSLGLSAIYFTPIFKSPANHRYETSDYQLVDPEFGTNDEFYRLSRELNKIGIRTVLDGVFNHTATNFLPFKDIVEKGKDSSYLGWYTIKSFPVRIGENPNYVAWFNYPSMPKLNTEYPAARKYLLDTVEFWAKNAAMGGWRLDAANEVSQDTWRAFRTKVKSLNPDYWIVGEEWGNASTWLKGDQWDSVMNYPFMFAVLDYLKPNSQVKPSTFLGRLFANYNQYAPQVSRNLMNFLGTHDTARILTQLEGQTKRRDLAALIEFSWVGAPCIYYGDEIGMEGGRDPQNRRAMRWDLANDSNTTLAYYRKLIQVRNASPELQHGDPILLQEDDAADTLAFGRLYNGRTAVAAINRSNQSRTIKIGRQLLGKRTGQLKLAVGNGKFLDDGKTISIMLAPQGAAILVPNRDLQSSLTSKPIASAPSFTRSEIL